MISKRELGLMAALVLTGVPSHAEPFGTPVTTGKSARAFAPKGFKIESETKADLTGDGVPDAAVVLVSPASDDSPGRRALLFLRGEQGGGFVLMGSSGSVLPSPGDCGIKGEECTPDISVKKNVVNITVSGGSRESWRRTLRFRPNAASGKVELIGRDESSFDGLTEAAESTSINYVTQDRTVTKTPARTDDDGKEIVPTPKPTTTKDKAPVKLQAIEELTE